MKKIALLLLAFLMLCGCSRYGDNIKPILSGISFTANISFYNEAFVCDGLIDKEHNLKLIVKEPENIEGLTFSVENEIVTAEYKGITYTPSTGASPFGSAAENIYFVLSDAKERLYPVTRNADSFIIQSAKDDAYYKITLAPTGLPLTLEYPSKGLTVSFMNLTII